MKMRDLFSGYYQPRNEEFDQIWENCIFVFDTNVLLNIYRYTPKTRERFFDILTKLKDRIWIPYQVAYEYQKNRQNVIEQQFEAYIAIKDALSTNISLFDKSFNNYKKHTFINDELKSEILKVLQESQDKVSELLDKSLREHKLINFDDLRDKLDEILGNNIGNNYTKKELEDLYKIADERFKNKIPPGYKDEKNKEGAEKYGDFIIWRQLVDYVKSQKKHLIFVIDENKEDWWLKNNGKKKGVRPELVEEIYLEAGVIFYMYSSDKFIDYAENFLSLPHEQEIIEEARDIRIQNEEDQLTEKKLIEKKKAVKRARELAQQAAALARIDPEFLKKIQATTTINPLVLKHLQTTSAGILKATAIDPEVLKQLQITSAGILKATAIDPEVLKQLQTTSAAILQASAINPELFKQLQINLQGYSDIIKTISLNNYEEDIDSTLDIKPTSD